MNKININETTSNDLTNIMQLWNNGEVMQFVGFPNGLEMNMEKMYKWFEWVTKAPLTKHYSIYSDEIGYCGETFYAIDTIHDLATLDIKLMPYAQGKGIGTLALSFVLDEIFNKQLATKAYVDPNPLNTKALKLYDKLGFISKTRPDFLEEGSTYWEITAIKWLKK